MAVIAVLVGSSLISGIGAPDEVDTGEAISDITSGNVDTATLIDRDQVLELTLRNGDEVRSHFITGQGVELQNLLQEKTDAGQLPGGYNVVVPSENLLVTLFISLLPFALLILLMVFIFSQMQGGGGRLMNFGKSKAKAITKDMPQTTFEDVAGSDEAVEELVEIKDFLSDAERFQKVGAKIPKGVLLYGPPGTGKTLLARAVAGEAGAPFYSISGSDFVEMFVGVGASRVRDLFEQAKANAPAIIFIDEIDAVGRHRGAGLGGGHDEREQTLNQMLVEMDGFDVTGGVILIAATNRPDILDPALLRPGRFDRQIAVERPDLNGRYEILKVHAKGKPITDDMDLMAVARRTPGFTGADLANVLNEAALLTARSDKTFLDDEALDEPCPVRRAAAADQPRLQPATQALDTGLQAQQRPRDASDQDGAEHDQHRGRVAHLGSEGGGEHRHGRGRRDQQRHQAEAVGDQVAGPHRQPVAEQHPEAAAQEHGHDVDQGAGAGEQGCLREGWWGCGPAR